MDDCRVPNVVLVIMGCNYLDMELVPYRRKKKKRMSKYKSILEESSFKKKRANSRILLNSDGQSGFCD